MKKAVIYVFSGTGNTLTAARLLADELAARGYGSDVFSVRTPFEAAPPPGSYDAAVFGYPIHAFNTPAFFMRFVKTLPAVNGIPAYIFKTSGEPFRINGASSYLLYKALKKRGFAPKADLHMLMPYNIMFRYKDALAKQMYLHTGRMCAFLARQIAEERAEKLRYPLLLRGFSCFFRIQRLGARINGPLYRADAELCSGCGKCAARCPAGNIVMENSRPTFGGKCAMCMGCVMRCPHDAVRPGFLSGWRVSGEYDFKALTADAGVPAVFVDGSTTGYFCRFRRYYSDTQAMLEECESASGPKRGGR